MKGFSGVIISFFVLAVFCGSLVTADEWSYKRENSWPGMCKTGHHQSPINLRKDRAQRKVYNDIQFKGYNQKFPAFIINTGHTVAVKINPDELIPTILGGGLLHEYKFDHFHFHWNSEHTFNNNRYPLELHFVHYANIFNSTTAASSHKDGIAVLGVIFDISEDDNPALEPLLAKFPQITETEASEVQLDEGISLHSFLPKDVDNFFRYDGSLTTPNCNEAVVWTVFYHLSLISKKQLEYFHTIRTQYGILSENYRSIQDLYDRVLIFRSSLQSKATINDINLSTQDGRPVKQNFIEKLMKINELKTDVDYQITDCLN